MERMYKMKYKEYKLCVCERRAYRVLPCSRCPSFTHELRAKKYHAADRHIYSLQGGCWCVCRHVHAASTLFAKGAQVGIWQHNFIFYF